METLYEEDIHFRRFTSGFFGFLGIGVVVFLLMLNILLPAIIVFACMYVLGVLIEKVM
jgi:hypothetical protein